MFENKNIFILGFARSGYEAAKFLVKRGNRVTLNDAKDEDKLETVKIQELRELGVNFIFGSHPDEALNNDFDYFIKNPGVPIDHKYVLKARELGIPVINEVEMAYQLLPKDITLIGITGTNGKTTTTTLIYEIIAASGRRVHLAGNIGYPLCSFLDKLQSGDIIVMEVSCQQLENVDLFKPRIAVMTNLSPAHVDFFHTYEAYKKVKSKIFAHQTVDDIAVLNMENTEVLELSKNIKSSTVYFSSKNEINGCYIKDGVIYYYAEEIIAIKDIFLVGKHNLENIMSSIMVVKQLNISNETIVDVLKTFKGVEHRLEFVRNFRGRLFYNDTEATNIKSTEIALQSFEKPVILYLGGLDRGQDFNLLKENMTYVKAIIGIGQSRERVLEFGKSLQIPTYIFEHLREAFKKSYEVSDSGDIILLSPASASWDQYKQCEDRGLEFKEYVEELTNED
ncbi:MAG: UDP-N-acetylmuramoyl-L-alanine--D-glutamate ligase [Bacilli bacterium]